MGIYEGVGAVLVRRLRSDRVTDRDFERLYAQHVGDIYRYALAVLANPADAEDVTQTAFLNAYRAFQQGQRPQRPLNWLIAITHNVCRQRFRQAARRPTEVTLDYDIGADLVEDDPPRAEEIQRALSQLAFNQRSALVMRELEGRSYAEIADVLGVSVAAVETLLFRARRALREQLEGALSCSEAERAISRQLDGELPHSERGTLRAHLRECPECATLARRMRATRSGFKALMVVPLPGSLAGLFGSGTGAVSGVAGGFALKAAMLGAAAVFAAGTGYEVAAHPAVLGVRSSDANATRVQVRAASSTVPSRRELADRIQIEAVVRAHTAARRSVPRGAARAKVARRTTVADAAVIRRKGVQHRVASRGADVGQSATHPVPATHSSSRSAVRKQADVTRSPSSNARSSPHVSTHSRGHQAPASAPGSVLTTPSTTQPAKKQPQSTNATTTTTCQPAVTLPQAASSLGQKHNVDLGSVLASC